ncbi:AAA family ATPase [Sedimenticola hydrogenitrophicus]|uniref:AAA family ATPase n=1 Tax=Sedimenticola hydrogenitrophicus TaxID=2967975 RepID=UPI0023B1807E|nr:AAA family ATPase [Sedimenticola hydrogenitrophicus]
MKELHDLELILTSHTPIIVIESLEEVRVSQMLARLGLRLNHPMFQWTVTEGLRRLEADFGAQQFTAEPREVLKHIKAVSQAGYYLLLDFHPFLDDPIHVRLIKEIAQEHGRLAKTLIFLSHDIPLPAEIRHLTARFNLRLPDRAGIKMLIKEEARRWQSENRRQVQTDAKAIDRLAANLTGITTTDARRLIRSAIENDGAISQDDLPGLMKTKYELINQDGVIAFEYDTASFAEVAGLTRLKEWLSHRHNSFAGNSASLDQPRGILLLGVQGAGKSLAAKAVAGTFGVPLLRIDFGALYNKYIGETEKNLRSALEVAESMAPCVLWMDEIEKGVSPGQADDGVSLRILGTLLTWMAENRRQVFIVATANDIQRLPPELIRKGRLDEIFFIDLPQEAVRREIFDIHLRRRNQAPSGFDLELLTGASEGFTGAEIEQAIVSALYAAQAQESRLDTRHLLQELERTRPLSVVMAEKMTQLRAWAAGRTVAAD